MKPIHILIVDDDKEIRQLLSTYLQNNGYLTTTAKDGQDAREKLTHNAIDLAIVDVMMPKESGITFTQLLRSNDNNLPILMLTALDTIEDRISGYESGIDDYLAKPFEPRELLLRIQSILRRSQSHTPPATHLVQIGENTFNPDIVRLYNGDHIIALSSNEEKLLTLLSKQLGTPISRESLAKAFSGVNERTIDVQITRLRSKIEPNPKKPIYLKTIRNQGYVLYGEYKTP